MGLDARKPVFGSLQTTKARSDQPAHSGSLISAFVFRFLESIIFKPATSEISTEETGLNIALSETPKTGFVASQPILCCILGTIFSNYGSIKPKFQFRTGPVLGRLFYWGRMSKLS